MFDCWVDPNIRWCCQTTFGPPWCCQSGVSVRRWRTSSSGSSKTWCVSERSQLTMETLPGDRRVYQERGPMSLPSDNPKTRPFSRLVVSSEPNKYCSRPGNWLPPCYHCSFVRPDCWKSTPWRWYESQTTCQGPYSHCATPCTTTELCPWASELAASSLETWARIHESVIRRYDRS